MTGKYTTATDMLETNDGHDKHNRVNTILRMNMSSKNSHRIKPNVTPKNFFMFYVSKN